MGDLELDTLAKYPAVSAFMKDATVYRDVSSLYVSNTYPIHASISTGVMPNIHGITANYMPFPEKNPIWFENEKDIRVQTLWQAAFKKGIETAAVLWPVTAYSKTIKYNIPEIHAQPGENQILANLKAGSKLLQLTKFFKHRNLINGTEQPALDYFATACMADIISDKKPGLALIHLVAYDALCHKYGKGSPELDRAYKSLDDNLSTLLNATGPDRDVLIFSDHSQQNVHTSVNLNKMLVKMGLLTWDGEKYLQGSNGCFIESCGGSAFFHSGSISASAINEIKKQISKTEGFKRFITADEMNISGQTSEFGFCAKEGYFYESFPSDIKATHGYPLDTADYKVFYMIKGAGISKGMTKTGGSILDISKLISNRLKLEIDS